MATARSQDNFVAYIAAGVVVCVVAIVGFTWNQIRIAHDVTRPHVAFAKFGPYQIENQFFALHASLAVQTSLDDSSWPDKNRKALDVVFKQVLNDIDPNAIKSPKRLETLQDALAKGCSNTFKTPTVQAVLLTDFTFQARDAEG